MFFLGTTFFSGRNTIDPAPTRADNIQNITIQDGTYSQLLVSKNPDLNVTKGYEEWDFDTVLNARFENSLDAGNSGFSLHTTDTILVKCREAGTFDWLTIYHKGIETVEDFKINIRDYYRCGSKNYEYMVVSVCNGMENVYVTQEIYSEFEGLYICDKDNIYGTLYDLDYLDNSINTNGTTLDLLNSRYPAIVNNSMSHYATGTTSATFIRFNSETNEIDLSGGNRYREVLKQWLNNRRPKILKFHDGRIWLISINGTISDTADAHNDKRKLSFDWVEIGNVNDAETLYNNGLSDVGREWWY